MQNCDKWCVALDWFGLLNEGTAKAQDVQCVLPLYILLYKNANKDGGKTALAIFHICSCVSIFSHTYLLCLNLHLSLQLKFLVSAIEKDTSLCHCFFLCFDLLVFVLFVQQ